MQIGDRLSYSGHVQGHKKLTCGFFDYIIVPEGRIQIYEKNGAIFFFFSIMGGDALSANHNPGTSAEAMQS